MPTARFVGGLAANRVGSELERLTKEVRARAHTWLSRQQYRQK
jgi:hypothetical protein